MEPIVRMCQKCKRRLLVVEVILCAECAQHTKLDVDVGLDRPDEETDEETDSIN